jgi:hypothetical protein
VSKFAARYGSADQVPAVLRHGMCGRARQQIFPVIGGRTGRRVGHHKSHCKDDGRRREQHLPRHDVFPPRTSSPFRRFMKIVSRNIVSNSHLNSRERQVVPPQRDHIIAIGANEKCRQIRGRKRDCAAMG